MFINDRIVIRRLNQPRTQGRRHAGTQARRDAGTQRRKQARTQERAHASTRAGVHAHVHAHAHAHGELTDGDVTNEKKEFRSVAIQASVEIL